MNATREQRILVVDDELALRVLMQQYLTRLGYEVEACATGTEALERLRNEPQLYWLVLADIVMPEVSGPQLVLTLLRSNPKLCVLVCSGVPFPVSTLPPEYHGQVRYLAKPFAPQMLAAAVRELEEVARRGRSAES